MYEAVSDTRTSIIDAYKGTVSSMNFVHHRFPEKMMYYPLSFGDSDSSCWRATVIPMGTGPTEPSSEESGYTKVTADAYGTLKTPVSAFFNTIRVKVKGIYADSTSQALKDLEYPYFLSVVSTRKPRASPFN